jgi:hypothetical protein
MALLAYGPSNQRLAVGLTDGTYQVWYRESPTTHADVGPRPRTVPAQFLARRAIAADRVWLVDLRPDHQPLSEIRNEAETLARRKLDARGGLVPHTSP